MNNKIIWIIIGIIVLALAVWIVNSRDNVFESEQETPAAMDTQESFIPEANVVPEMTKTDEVKIAGTYQDYSTESVAAASAEGNKVVLFFHATWCPYCRTADEAFKTKLSEIPDGVSVFKTDYDSEKALKTKYAVTTQHTFVQIDADGNKIISWVSGDTELLKANLK